MAKLLLLLCLTVISNTLVFATTFVPLTIKKQIEDSDGVVVGEILNISSYQKENGQIYSRAFIKAEKWIGAKVENDHIEISFPGGKLNGRVFKVFGAPQFENGEKVVLFTRNINNQSFVNYNGS